MRIAPLIRNIALASIAVLALACGGGGGGGNPGNVTISLTPTSASVGGNGQVDLVATVTGAANTDVTWSSTSGVVLYQGIGKARFVAGMSSATVTATSIASPSKSAACSVTVTPGLATVRGRVIQNDNFVGVPGIVVEFRNGGGSVLSTATTDGSGNFSAAVPASAVSFFLRSASFPAGYYKDWKYNTKHYSPLIITCSALLPALSPDVSTSLLTNVVVYRDYEPPPPPPTGCGT